MILSDIWFRVIIILTLKTEPKNCTHLFICNESIRSERIFLIDSFLKKEPRESIRLGESDATSLTNIDKLWLTALL